MLRFTAAHAPERDGEVAGMPSERWTPWATTCASNARGMPTTCTAMPTATRCPQFAGHPSPSRHARAREELEVTQVAPPQLHRHARAREAGWASFAHPESLHRHARAREDSPDKLSHLLKLHRRARARELTPKFLGTSHYVHRRARAQGALEIFPTPQPAPAIP